jgi:hypothetical protein
VDHSARSAASCAEPFQGDFPRLLGTKDGIGLAIWTFDWGPRESHYDHHRYRIKFYRWNQAVGKLVSGGSRLTRQLDRDVKAALGAGIDPDDVIEASTLQSWITAADR